MPPQSAESRAKGLLNNPQRIEVVVFDTVAFKTDTYLSIGAAAIALGVNRYLVYRYSLSGKLVLGRYRVTRLESK